MEIKYVDKKTEDYISGWLKSCAHPYVVPKINDNEIYVNLMGVNKNKLFKRILMETECFNDDINILVGIGEHEFSNLQKMDFKTSEGEIGELQFHKASFDDGASISVIQDESERTFYYEYRGNPMFCKENLLKERIVEKGLTR